MKPNDQHNELQELLAELCAESLNEEQAVRLLEILERDPAARQIYVETVRLHCNLAYLPNLQLPLESQATGSTGVPPGTADSVESSRSPVLGFLGGVVNLSTSPRGISLLCVVVLAIWGLVMLRVLYSLCNTSVWNQKT